LILSNRQRDRFDPATLLRLPRRLKVLCPNGPEILHALARLGYSNVEPFRDWSFHEVGDVSVVFTPSSQPTAGNGFVATDGEAVFWNHEDAVPSAATVERIRETMGTVDLVSICYQPMLEPRALYGKAASLRQDEYSTIVQRAKLLSTRALVPSGGGYRVGGK